MLLPFASGTAQPAPHHSAGCVALGGGTGLPVVLRGLVHARAQTTKIGDLTAIVAVTDDGGSSGQLRDALGVLPPGDIRNCLSALTPLGSPLGDVLHERMRCEGVEGEHPIGNLLLTALTRVQGDLLGAIRSLSAIMGTAGRVLPATLADVRLRGDFSDGAEVVGETAIAARRARIDRVRLTARAAALPECLDAIGRANLIVAGPGSLYTSVIPTLLVDKMRIAVERATATRVYVANLMTQPGETDDFSLADHLAALRYHAGGDLFDYVLVNRRPISPATLAAYARQGSRPVVHDGRRPWSFRTRIVTADIAVTTPSGILRHNPVALGYALAALARPRAGGAVPTPHAPSTETLRLATRMLAAF
ncbi:MAG TPA: uridine diphosphate-N-acetylglucosamine-binding protein YvcK [Vicinamibacterales bacterium]|nr:uridine diphosphate-N-acetylglucosamine-binding protein YvcK [Vicinamibacterales bacterium]